jgi:hypothetical protein
MSIKRNRIDVKKSSIFSLISKILYVQYYSTVRTNNNNNNRGVNSREQKIF